MARNRVIHNVQDVFVGSAPNESDSVVTSIANHQILKRLNRVQGFDYSINLNQEDSATLGKSKPFSRDVSEPPEVSLSFNYYINGVDNERKIGLNTGIANCITKDMVSSNLADKRNIYLIINDKDVDVRQNETWDSSQIELEGDSLTESYIEDPNAKNYGYVCFQNCYLTSYNVNISPNELPSVDVNYVSDNINADASASGIGIPVLNTQNGAVTHSGVEFIVPKKFKDDVSYSGDFTSSYSHSNLTITSATQSGVTGFLNDHINSLSIGIDIQRQAISYVGHKLISDRKPNVVMNNSLSLEAVVKENVSGNFLDNANENERFNIEVELKNKSDETLSKYTFSGAKLSTISYSNSVNQNKTVSMEFNNYMDLENQTEGVFVSGKISTVQSGESFMHPPF
tara:strand:+ start:1054 stop:2250 length:1197 start_codon:yes stop_codon:yes gene_type:complete